MKILSIKGLSLSLALIAIAFITPQVTKAALTVGAVSITTDSTLSLQGGDVGIGTLSPDQELEVVGNIAIPTTVDATSGVIYKGADPFIHNFALAGSDGQNTYIGINAGNFTMTGSVGGQGSYNTGVGRYAGASNTTGSFNSSYGGFSLYSNGAGSYNNGYGHNSLLSNSTGSYNIGVGYRSLFSNTTGSYNIAIGHQALFDQNILDSTGANTAIGYNTGRGITTGINNTVIGANVTGLSAALSNNIIIADGAGNQRINVDSAGEVGLGTNDPTEKLDINSDAIRLRNTRTPALATETCVQGEIGWDTSYIYVCVATDTWKRSAIATW